jgi:hypothetical protein
MVPGFNSSVTHGGIEYHIQTEDMGEKNPCVLTLIYRGGAIVSREKVDYRKDLGEQVQAPQIKTFMEEQHQRIVQRIADRGLEHAVAPSPALPSAASPTAPRKSVDDLIAEYLRRRKRGTTR